MSASGKSGNGPRTSRASTPRKDADKVSSPSIEKPASTGEKPAPAGPLPPAEKSVGKAEPLKEAARTPAATLPPKATAPAGASKTGRRAKAKPTGAKSTGAKPVDVKKTVPATDAAKDRSTPAAMSETTPAAKPHVTPAAAAKHTPTPLPASTSPALAPEVKSQPSPQRREALAGHLLAPERDVDAVLAAAHRDPFSFLGMHTIDPPGALVVRAFLPGARTVDVIDAATKRAVATLTRVREEGMFAGEIEGRNTPFAYRLSVEGAERIEEIDDPYRFPPVLGDDDARRLAEGNHLESYRVLGSHPMRLDGVDGMGFAVWAPNARRVAVIGDFNGWDGRCHGMRLRHDCGVWEIFLPGVTAGHAYKYEIKTSSGQLLTDKCDPYARQVEPSPGSASIICDLAGHRWGDEAWMAERRAARPENRPISIYEVHLGSWRRRPEEGHRTLTYTEFAEGLVDYVTDLGFTHVQLMPVSEFDFDASLGYQPFAPYAPTSRWGRPDGFRTLVDRCHQAGIGVILDWVPNHFSDDPHGLRNFDGTHLYEHHDVQRRSLPGANTLVYDYGRREVANYLISNALYWCDVFHIDALRVADIAPMLYLDYSRPRGEWTPNRFGGPENLEAIDFLRRLNAVVSEEYPGVFTIAEDTSNWPRITHREQLGGLSFGFKWNLDWVRDTLRYLSRNPVHRKYYHDELTYGPSVAFREKHILPFSHHDVGYGRGSMLHKMPGDRWQRFANLRTCYAFLYGHPGKKLLFMGDEFAQEREWNADISLDWHVLDDPMNRGIQRLVRDLNELYRSSPALYDLDADAEGFSWIDCNDTDQSVLSFCRHGRKDSTGHRPTTIVVTHYTPVVREHYRIGVPEPGAWRVRVNTDLEHYGGADTGSRGVLTTLPEPMHGRDQSLDVTLPPFGSLILDYEGPAT